MVPEMAEESRLRVGLDYRPAILSSTGIARSVRELARALSGLSNLDLHLFAHSFAPARRAETLERAVLHRLPIPGRLMPFLARMGLGADRLSASVPLFHWMDYVHPPVSRARSILTIHDLAFAVHSATQSEAVGREMLERTGRAAQQASICVCPSAASARQVEEVLELDPNRVRVIPFGIDHIPKDLPVEKVPAEPFLLSLGTIEPRKNHQRLLAAWRRLGKDRPLLVVIGRRGWECDATIAQLQQEEEAGRLRWLQNATDSLVFAHMDRAEALLYPSHLEGFGFPALEALALGTPVLAGDSPALREVLQDTALYCEPESEEHIHEQVRSILEDSSEKRARSENGRRRAREFTWQACAERHLDLYREVLA